MTVGVPVARAVLVAGAVPLAGVLLAPLVAGPADRTRRRVWVVRAGAVLGGGAGLLLGLWSPSRGWVPAGALVMAALVTGLVGAGRGPDGLLGAGVLAGAAMVEPAPTGQLAAGAVHLVASALWVGLVLQLAVLSGRPGLARRAARLHRPAVALTAAVVLSGVAESYLHLPDAGSLPGSGYGRLILAKAALVGAAALLGWAGHRRAPGRRARAVPTWLRREAGGLGAATVLAGALVLAPLPTVAAPGAVGFGTAARAGGPVSVVAVPASGDGELVFVGFGDPGEGPGRAVLVADGAIPRPAVPARPLGAGRYVARLAGRGRRPTSVEIQIGPQSFLVRLAGAAAAVPAGAPGPDAVTLDTVLGRLAALAVTPSLESPAPVDQPGQDRAQGAALASFLRACGVRSAGLALDPADARSRAFGAAFRRGFAGMVADNAGSPDRLPAGDALVLAGRPDQATALLDQARRDGLEPGGVILAPWLLTPPVLDDAIEGGPAVSVAADADPNGPGALAFVSAEGRATPGFAPTYDGLTAFTAALGPGYRFGGGFGRDGAAGFRLYAATAVQFLPAVLGDHNHGIAGWFTSGGQLVPVTPPLG